MISIGFISKSTKLNEEPFCRWVEIESISTNYKKEFKQFDNEEFEKGVKFSHGSIFFFKDNSMGDSGWNFLNLPEEVEKLKKIIEEEKPHAVLLCGYEVIKEVIFYSDENDISELKCCITEERDILNYININEDTLLISKVKTHLE